MYKLFYSLLICMLLTSSCVKETLDERSYEYFRLKLKPDMTYADLQATFGDFEDDAGSGIHIYLYRLRDFTEIRIGYTDRILYARHFDTNGQLLHTLI